MSWKDKIGRARRYSQDFEGRDDIVQWDALPIQHEQTIKVNFVKTNSQYKQGIRLAVDAGEGRIEVLGQTAKAITLWEDTAPRDLICKCFSTEGLLSIYNIYHDGRNMRSLMYGSGMLIQENGDKITYSCNDVGIEGINFDKLIFTIEKL